MVKTHRKLFPLETNANQTQNCYGVCDLACPYNCYSYPNYYFSPPPPPPNQVNHVPSYMIIIVSLFTVIFAVAAFYVIKLKCYNDLCGRRVNRSNPSQSNNNEQFVNENQVDHPVWLINTVGLQQSIINSITVCKYKKDEGLIEKTECSVCLNEFREGECLRLLPKCNHAFHIPCIDTWLRSHINCPICRANIVSSNNVSVTSETAMSNLASTEQENVNLGRNQDTQMDNSHNDGVGGSEEASELREFNDESNFKDHVHDVLYDEIQVVNVLKQESDYTKKCKRMCRSSIEGYLHISPVSMKRSFSYNGRILCSRSYKSLKNTLPYKNFQSIKYLHSIR